MLALHVAFEGIVVGAADDREATIRAATEVCLNLMQRHAASIQHVWDAFEAFFNRHAVHVVIDIKKGVAIELDGLVRDAASTKHVGHEFGCTDDEHDGQNVREGACQFKHNDHDGDRDTSDASKASSGTV